MSSINPSICAIVPVYKIPRAYLDQCVDSLRNQTYGNLKIILVDDHSPDDCGAWCDAYAAMDARIIVIHNTRNSGVSQSRNNALMVADADYITFVDADDWMDADCIEKVVDSMCKEDDLPQVILFQECLNYVNKEVRSEAVRRKWKDREALNDLQLEALSFMFKGAKPRATAIDNIAGKLISLRLIRENSIYLPQIPYREDGVFFQELIEKAACVLEVPEGMYHYRMRKSSAVNSYNATAPEDQAKLMKLHWDFADRTHKGEDYRRALYAFTLVPMQMCITTHFYHRQMPLSLTKRHAACRDYFGKEPYKGAFSHIRLGDLSRHARLKATMMKHRMYYGVQVLGELYMAANKKELFD